MPGRAVALALPAGAFIQGQAVQAERRRGGMLPGQPCACCGGGSTWRPWVFPPSLSSVGLVPSLALTVRSPSDSMKTRATPRDGGT